MKTTAGAILILLATLVPAGTRSQTAHRTRERTFHVLHYKLNVSINLKEKRCEGDVALRLVPLRPLLEEVALDAAGLKVSQAMLGSTPVKFRQVRDSLILSLDAPRGLKDTLSLDVSYAVTAPPKGLYFISPDSGYPARKYQAWTQGEPEESHYWFPCYDFPNDMATSEVIATVDAGLTAISNGRLLEVKKDAARQKVTFHWSEEIPHASYLISLVVGDYVEVKDAWGAIPLSYYVYPSQRDAALRSFGKTPKMIEFFSVKTGYPYPWEKYAQTVVEEFLYGGQENVSATTLTDATIHDARAHLDVTSDGLVAHELAHMWWGDLLTCRDWSQAWLNEGFATYFENLFTEYDRGKDEAARELLESEGTLRNLDVGVFRRPTVSDRYIQPMDLFDSHIYAKGAVVLGMLRFTIGDELFWQAVRHYVHKFAHQNVETNDFKVAIEEATGYNLNWFFDQWVYKAGYPELEITSRWDQASRSLRLIVQQTQKVDSLTGMFTLPVEIEVWVNGVPQTYRTVLSHAADTLSFPAYQEPQLVIFDKGSRLLKSVRFQKSTREWIFQLQNASEGVDRYLAAEELSAGAGGDSLVRAALSGAALQDQFWAVRQNAVWALGGSKSPGAIRTLMAAYGDRDARVRAASIASLGNYGAGGEQVLGTLRHAFEKDSSYSVAAAALQALFTADSAGRTAYCREALKRDSYNEIIRSSALRLLAENGDEEALSLITSSTRYGVNLTIRIQAVEALARKWSTREDVLFCLIGLLKDPSIHLRRAVAGALGAIGNPKALDALRSSLARETDSRLLQQVRGAIDKIQEKQQPH
jgi:aminopeptidase N